VLYEGAVVADEHHDERFAVFKFAIFEVSKADLAAVDVRHSKSGGLGAQRQHGAGCLDH
jgi:hypothetical protein